MQLRGDGAIQLLVIDCDEALNIRCMAQHQPGLTPGGAPLAALFGNGQLLISLDLPSQREP